MNAAFGLAKIQLEYILSCRRNFKAQQDSSKPSILGTPRIGNFVDAKTKIPIKSISPTQMEETKKKGLCYNCDEKWGLWYKCNNAKIFLLEGIDIVPNSSGVQISELEDEVESVDNKELDR